MSIIKTFDQLHEIVVRTIKQFNIKTPDSSVLDTIEQSSKDFVRLKNLFQLLQSHFSQSYDDHFVQLGKQQFQQKLTQVAQQCFGESQFINSVNVQFKQFHAHLSDQPISQVNGISSFNALYYYFCIVSLLFHKYQTREVFNQKNQHLPQEKSVYQSHIEAQQQLKAPSPLQQPRQQIASPQIKQTFEAAPPAQDSRFQRSDVYTQPNTSVMNLTNTLPTQQPRYQQPPQIQQPMQSVASQAYPQQGIPMQQALTISNSPSIMPQNFESKFQEDIRKYQDQIMVLTAQNETLKRSNMQLQGQLSVIGDTQRKTLQMQAQRFEKAEEEYKDKIKNLSEQVGVDSLNTLNNLNLEQELKQYKDNANSIFAENVALSEKYNQCVAKLRVEEQKQVQLEKQLLQVEQEAKLAQQQKEQLEERLNRQVGGSQQLQSQLQELQKLFQEQKQQYDQIYNENISLKKGELEQTSKEAQKDLELQKLQQSVQILNTQLSQANQEKQVLQRQVLMLQSAEQAQQEKIRKDNDWEQQIQKLKEQNKSQEDLIGTLKAQIIKSDSNYQQAERQFTKQISDLKQEGSVLSQQLRSKQEELDNAKINLQKLELTGQRYLEQLQELQTQQLQQQQGQAEMINQIQSLTQQLDVKKQELIQKEQEIAALNTDISKYGLQVQQQISQINQLTKQVNDPQIQNNAEHAAQVVAQMEELAHKLQAIQRENEELRRQVQSSGAEALKVKIANLEREIEQRKILQSKMKGMDMEIPGATLQEQFQTLQNDYQTLQQDKEFLEQFKLAELERSVRDKEQKITELQRQLEQEKIRKPIEADQKPFQLIDIDQQFAYIDATTGGKQLDDVLTLKAKIKEILRETENEQPNIDLISRIDDEPEQFLNYMRSEQRNVQKKQPEDVLTSIKLRLNELLL